MKSTRENYIHEIKISDIAFPNNVWLAPMAGVSGKALRSFVKMFGAGCTFTEMVSLEGIMRGNKKTLQYLDIREEENTIIQLFGKCEPDKFYKAGKILQQRCGAKIVDINFGCPVRKVVRSGAGSALLKTPQSMKDIVKALKDSGLFVSAKIRSGFDSVNIEETIPALDDSGADMIILHPRLAIQFYNGSADWNLIKAARKLTRKVLIASGDVKTPEDAEELFKSTNPDGIMIGRQATGSPFLFKQILDHFQNGSYNGYSLEEIKGIMLEFSELFIKIEKRDSIKPIRTILIQYVRNYQNSREIRHRISLIDTIDELKEILKSW